VSAHTSKARSCPDCRRHRVRLGSPTDRRFYATSYGIHQLEDKPASAALVIAEKFPQGDVRLLRRWGSLCWTCRERFELEHSADLVSCLAQLAGNILNKAEAAEKAAVELRYFVGAAAGVLDYARGVRREAQERLGRDATAPGHVYANRSGRHLKIGFAQDVQERMTALQVLSPRKVELVGSVTGYREHERKIQRRFAEYHVRGEWFRDCDPIRRFFSSSYCLLSQAPSKARSK